MGKKDLLVIGLIVVICLLQGANDVNAQQYSVDYVDVDYELTIDDPSSGEAHVKMTVSNIQICPFSIIDPLNLIQVVSLTAYNENGDSFSVVQKNDSINKWIIKCSGDAKIIIEYTVNPAVVRPEGQRGDLEPLV